MSLDSLIAEFEFGSGAQRGSRLTLYANRLVHQGGDLMETVPLAKLAAVGVAFERDSRKLNWAVALLVLALVLASLSGPLQSWIAGALAKVGDPARPESLDAVLAGVLNALGGFARLVPAIAAAFAAGALALAFFFWLGKTTLTLCYAAVERAYAVRGRNRFLIEFAESVADRLAARKD